MSYEELIVKLIELSIKDTFSERTGKDIGESDFNRSDCYEAGLNDGETFLARELLDKLGVK